MLVVAVVAGLAIGASLGALGGGGSILTVPVLVYLLGQSPHQATTASLVVVGVAALFGAAWHYRAGRVRLRANVAGQPYTKAAPTYEVCRGSKTTWSSLPSSKNVTR